MLSPRDEKLLRSILEIGRRLESRWPTEEGSRPDATLLALLDELKSLIACAGEAESEALSRLSFHTRNLTPEMTARHLTAILVPFERLSGRALRDDEFLVTSDDAPAESERAVAPFVVVADNLRSAFNVGAIFRTAEAFGAERVILSGYTPTPDNDKTARTSLGADRSIAWEATSNASEAIAKLRAEGYSIIALETSARATDLDEFNWPEKPALILGNERFGLDHDVLRSADHLLRIPLFGRKNSLNVGIAFGIAVAAWRSAFEKKLKADGPQRTLTPIGIFRANAKYPYEARRQGPEDASGDIGVIELNEGQMFEQALDGLEGFERIWILYHFHHNTHWKPKVMPPRGPRVKRGVFATRSPYRPNALGLSAVELVKIEGRKVYVRGFDLLDGTPVYDLKPYLPYADSFPEARAGWTEGLEAHAYQVNLSDLAERQLNWLENRDVTQMRGFLNAQLEFDPLDDERKRVVKNGDHYQLAYRTWRAEFSIDEGTRTITVLKITSGYSSADLSSTSEDRYQDKNLHREFNSQTWA